MTCDINAADTSALVPKGTRSLSGIASAPELTAFDLDLNPPLLPWVLGRPLLLPPVTGQSPGLGSLPSC
jgi:hypothetical protein